jgi:hypothetical protein
MQYFVSVEDKPYHQWQVNLLHHSMKLLGIEDRLLVAVARHEKRQGQMPTQNAFWHANVGFVRNYLPLNKPFAIAQAVREGRLKLPFTVIDPDMFFVRPVPLLDAAVSAQHMTYMDHGETERMGWNTERDLGVKREDWIPLGVVYQFRDVDPDLFSDIHRELQRIMAAELKFTDPKAVWQREMVAFVPPLVRRKICVNLVKDWETNLDTRLGGGADACLVHYANGYRPCWDKRFFQLMDGGLSFQSLDPYQSVLDIESNDTNVVRFQELVRSYLAENAGG